MAVYWVTEALPLAVTAFIPVVLFPALGVATAYQTSTNYLKVAKYQFYARGCQRMLYRTRILSWLAD